MNKFFQSEEYLLFLANSGVLEPFCCVSQKARIQGYIQKDGNYLKRYLSRRAIINGGPRLSKDISESEIELLLLECITILKSKAIYIEIRNFNDYSQFRSVFERCGFIYEPHYDYIVNTLTKEIAEANLGKSRKRDIRTSLKNGALVIDDPSSSQIMAFYSILKDLYKKKVKTPLLPLNFFLKLHEAEFSKFLLIQYNNEIIGGTVCVFDDDTVYEWFACGKDGAYKNIFPSTLATWSGIRFAAETGRKRFDMMGAGAPGDGGYGVREFKAKFGGDLVEFGRFKYICNKPLYALGKWGVNLLKRI